MRTIKYKVCVLKLARVVDGGLSAAWEDDVLKHMTDKQANNYARNKYGDNTVVLHKDNVIKEINAHDAYFALNSETENSHE